MPHVFHEREEEPEPESGGSRFGGPPKRTAAGVLDPPVPPRKPPSPIPAIPRSTLIKISAAVILLGLALIAFLLIK